MISVYGYETYKFINEVLLSILYVIILLLI